MLKAVIFDVDGTLVDSNELHVRAWCEAFERYGKAVDVGKVREQMGKGGDQFMPVFCSREELDKFGEDMERYRTDLFTREYLPRVRPFPKVRELFERIRADKMQLALASSAREEELERHKKSLRIDDLLETATSAADAEKSKPHPDIFQAALEKLIDVSPREAVVIGDSPFDAEAARRAGLRAIGVLSGGFSEKQLRQAGVVEVYDDVAHLLALYDDSLLARESPRAAKR